jgi:hypothetical protein
MADYVFHLLGHESIVLTLNVMYFIIKTRVCIQKTNEKLKQGQQLIAALKRTGLCQITRDYLG